MIMSRAGARVLLLSVGMVLGLRNAEAGPVYVNASAKTGAAQDGTSWKTAFVSLQDALDVAASASSGSCGTLTEIWVAAGTYAPSKIYAPSGVAGGKYSIVTIPAPSIVPQMKTFDLPNCVAIYGGFSGSEKSLSQRSPSKNETILDGGKSSWHVVTAGNDVAQTGVRAVLDGLSITGGNANGPTNDLLFHPYNFNHDNGGGMTILYDSVIDIQNVNFHDNVSNGDGGGLFSIDSTLRITGSRFAQNFAPFRGGAAEIFNTFETSAHTASIESTTFDSNSAGVFGGAIVGEGTLPNDDSNLDINHCTFVGNTAFEGGAVVFDSQKTTVRNSMFQGNVATVNAGALSTTNVVDTIVNGTFFGPASPFTKFGTTVTNCDFINNQTLGDQAAHDSALGGITTGLNFAFGGGALVAYMNGYLDVSGSRFLNNVVLGGDGGAILNGRSEAENVFGSGADAFEVRTTISGCTFRGNLSAGNGGAVASMPGLLYTLDERTVGSTAVSVTGSIFSKNSAAGFGGGIYLDRSTATIGSNTYGGNQATKGPSLYGVDSVINGVKTGLVSE
jgi:predicted outer membrane repeat protein